MSTVIGDLRVILGLDSTAFQEGMQRATATLRNVGQSMQRIGADMSKTITAPLVGFGGLAIRTAANFETSMNRVGAVSGATEEQLQSLADVAKELGATTQFSASQAADAMSFLAMAGFKTDEIIGAMPGTLQLAAAAQLDMADAADIVSNILSGYTMDVEELARVNDVLVKTFTSANTDLRGLGEAMKYAGPVATAAGVEFEEAAAAIGMMGNAGIQGSMAGTSLRGAISRILSPTKAMRDAMAEAGLSFTDTEGRIKPLADIIEELEPHADNAGLMMELFGQRAGPAMAALVSQGADGLRDLTEELRNSGGTASEIAEAQMQGFNGAMLELRSAFEALQIAIAESGLIEIATDLVRGLTGLVGRLKDADPALVRFGVVIAGVAAALGPIIFALGLLAAGIAAIGAPAAAAIAGLALVGSALFAFKDEIGAALTAVVDFVNRANEEFKALPGRVVAVVSSTAAALAAGFQSIATQAVDWASAVVRSIIEGLEGLYQAGIEAVRELARGMRESVTGLIEDAAGWGRDIAAGLAGGVTRGAGRVRNAVTGLAARVRGAFTDEMEIQSPSRVFFRFGEWISEGLANGITAGEGQAQDAMKSLADGVAGVLTNAMQNGGSIGKGLRGLASSLLGNAASNMMRSGLSGLMGAIPGFATGGTIARGGLATINERGGELVALPSGSTVVPHDLSKQMMGGTAQSGGAVDVRVYVDDGGNWQAQVERISGRVAARAVGSSNQRLADTRYLREGR